MGKSFSIEKSRIFTRVPSLLTVYRRIVQGTLFLLIRTLGLTNYVPGSSRGTLFKSPSIFVVVESRRYRKSYAERRNSHIYFSYVLCAVNVQSFFWWKKMVDLLRNNHFRDKSQNILKVILDVTRQTHATRSYLLKAKWPRAISIFK